MRMTDIEKYNVTDRELAQMEQWLDGLSDLCEMTDGTWGIEWDGPYGRHWDRYDTEEEACEALDRHSDRCVEIRPQIREDLAQQDAEALAYNIAKGKRIAAEKRALKEAKTIGGNCPELAALLVKMRNERKTA
jgi:hypothetical protein